ncbi:hypothetical protein SGFS_061800 [Streptomyces graminofaciens]|jgi:hypothetical protein|uniref:Uncharacterized protein n=1 Tax=Streptomyces graminofaciens TaxID=68212 RepID=A0ABM9SC88_9ACTN|nr:hypothetical protein [Streptomyces graminofaciens]BBC34886.1 hypothetical protein SGFS_061800 [Streptomyces graminofaciens]
MTPWEVAIAQAEVTSQMILYTQAPIARKTRVRGVLPAPRRSAAVRIALGGRKSGLGDLSTIYEIPLLRGDEEELVPWDVVSRVRHAAAGVRLYSSDQVDTVLDTTLVRLVEDVPGKERREDRAHTLLTVLSCPTPTYEEREKESSLLVGFLYLRKGRMRLYVRHQGDPDVVGCDVRLAEAGPAVMAEVFSRSQDRELFEEPADDPHCAAVLDLAH